MAAHSEDFVDSSLHRFDRAQGCDGQTDRHLDDG